MTFYPLLATVGGHKSMRSSCSRRDRASPTFFQLRGMAPKRTTLAEIDGNWVVGGEVTAYTRGLIEGMKAGGASGRKIAGVVSCAESTI